MKISLQDPNNRLLIFLAAFIVIIGLLALDRLSNPPAGSGIITVGLWLLLFGITGAILYDVLHYERRPTARFSHYGGPDPGQTSSGNPWVQKANRALMIFCLSLAYEILAIFVVPGLLISLVDPGGTLGLDLLPSLGFIALITGIPIAFLEMWKSEHIYKETILSLDPDWAADVAAGVSVYSPYFGPQFFRSALLITMYMVFLGWFFTGLISPVLIPILPASVSPLFNPLLGGVTLALFATPAFVYLIYRRRE
jgi:hypothetical protein